MLKLLICFIIIGNVFSECHLHWEHFGDSCYLFSDHSLDWYRAQSACRSHNARLAEIETPSEWQFLHDKANRYGGFWWLGATDDIVEGVWEWSSSERPLTLTFWNPGEPNNSGDCLVIANYLDDSSCAHNMKYICERRYTDSFPGVGK